MESYLTPIDDALNRIFSNKEAFNQFKLTIDIYYDSLMKEVFNPILVSNVNIVRDYIENATDEFTITVSMGMGDLGKIIQPNRKNLKIGLKYTMLTDNPSNQNPPTPEYIVYKAFLLGEYASVTVAQGAEANSKEALNMQGMLDVSFQLVSQDFERIKVIQRGCHARNENPNNITSVYIQKAIDSLANQPDNILKRSYIVPFNNQDRYENITVKLSTYLTDLPHTLQEKPGCYNADIGSYIQDDCWYVYPLYDTSRFNKEARTCTIYVLPKKKYPSFERTWLIDGSSISIAISGDTKFKDDGGANYANFGNGARYAKAEAFLDAGKSSGNKFTFSRNETCNEFVSGTAIDAINNAPWGENLLTGNLFKEKSRLARRNGGFTSLTWKNSLPEIITPGMPCRIVYYEEDQLKNIYGVILGASSHYVKPGGISSSTFVSLTSLIVFTNGQVTSIDG